MSALGYEQKVFMERTITLPVFVEFSLSLLGFILLACLFFQHGNVDRQGTVMEMSRVAAIAVSQ
ncbi:hypothetical protein Mic7113_5782 [Allocoleopsis franciscana PCC 7113]|uniref:Uncharacterized protein n=2 Tax=Allocoleopsis TaxID=2886347 RepID=K9WPD0_9CYAN|nr:hypothetical protein Mic7113_5782 [Allocoleopsis franciscana PCC 7113]